MGVRDGAGARNAADPAPRLAAFDAGEFAPGGPCHADPDAPREGPARFPPRAAPRDLDPRAHPRAASRPAGWAALLDMNLLRIVVVAILTSLPGRATPRFAQDASVPREGFSLHYRSEGAGTPIVFLSGGPGLEVDYFAPAAKLFPDGYQRILLEQRGTGRSLPPQLTPQTMTIAEMVGDLEALRTHLKLERILLAGHSWGGMLAMAYAAAHPDRVDRLVLIGSGGPDTQFFEWFGTNIEARLWPADREARDTWNAAGKNGAPADKARLESLRAIIPGYFFRRESGLAFAKDMPDGLYHAEASTVLSRDIGANYDVREPIRKLARPVLILHGHQDPIGDKVAEDLHALIAGSTLKYLNECGHFPWIEQPEKTKAILAEFLRAGSGR